VNKFRETIIAAVKVIQPAYEYKSKLGHRNIVKPTLASSAMKILNYMLPPDIPVYGCTDVGKFEAYRDSYCGGIT